MIANELNEKTKLLLMELRKLWLEEGGYEAEFTPVTEVNDLIQELANGYFNR